MNDEVDYCFNLIKKMYRAKRYVNNKIVGPKTFFATQDELTRAMLNPAKRKVMFRIQKLINAAMYRGIGEALQENSVELTDKVTCPECQGLTTVNNRCCQQCFGTGKVHKEYNS